MCNTIDDLQQYLEGKATTEELCRVYLRKIEANYYKVGLLVKFDQLIHDWESRAARLEKSLNLENGGLLEKYLKNGELT